MKKKIIVAGLACALSLGCVLGATACADNGGGSSKGRSVTAEQWTAAFDKLYGSENITISKTMMSFDFEEGVQNGYVTYCTSCTSSIIFTKGEELGGECRYMINVEDTNYWVENFNYDGEKIEDWVVGVSNYQSIETYKLSFLNYDTFFNIKLKDSDNRYAVIKELYSAFKFKDGTYSAILNTGEGEVEICVKFDGDNIIYCGAKEPGADTEAIKFEFFDYGTTTVTLPTDVQKALDEYIAAKH